MLPDRHEARAGHIHIKWKLIPRVEEKVEGLRVDQFTEKYKGSQTGSYKFDWVSQRERAKGKECVETSQERRGNKVGVKVLDIKESKV